MVGVNNDGSVGLALHVGNTVALPGEGIVCFLASSTRFASNFFSGTMRVLITNLALARSRVLGINGGRFCLVIATFICLIGPSLNDVMVRLNGDRGDRIITDFYVSNEVIFEGDRDLLYRCFDKVGIAVIGHVEGVVRLVCFTLVQ